jgi:lipase chaperone LimK
MTKNSVLIAGIAAASVAIVGLAYWALSDDDSLAPTPARDASVQTTNSNTVADKWQWKNFASTKPTTEVAEGDKPRPASALPFDAMEVYKVLQGIHLDASGRLVPDQTAMKALEKGFNDLGPNLSAEAMSKLQDVIRAGLPGAAGGDAADLFENYYRLRLAEVAFDEQMASQSPTVDRYKELQQLRRNYLGQETADKLFAVEDIHARHMLASIAIQQDTNLTAEAKQTQQQALQEKLNDRLLASGQLKPEDAAAEKVGRLREQGASSADIYSTRKAIVGTEGARELAAADREDAQWQSRFNGFWQARRYVMQAGLDEAERERQIEQLLGQYFSPEEQQRARVTSSEWQARDATFPK